MSYMAGGDIVLNLTCTAYVCWSGEFAESVLMILRQRLANSSAFCWSLASIFAASLTCRVERKALRVLTISSAAQYAASKVPKRGKAVPRQPYVWKLSLLSSVDAKFTSRSWSRSQTSPSVLLGLWFPTHSHEWFLFEETPLAYSIKSAPVIDTHAPNAFQGTNLGVVAISGNSVRVAVESRITALVAMVMQRDKFERSITKLWTKSKTIEPVSKTRRCCWPLVTIALRCITRT